MQSLIIVIAATLLNAGLNEPDAQQPTTSAAAPPSRSGFIPLYDAGKIDEAKEQLEGTLSAYMDIGLPADSWQVRFAMAWKHELEIVSAFSEQRRVAFFESRAKTTDIYLKCRKGDVTPSLIHELNAAISAIPAAIDDSCPTRWDALEVLGELHAAIPDYQAAFRYFSELRRLRTQLVGADNWMYASDCELTGLCALSSDQLEAAENLLTECYELRRGLHGVDADQTLITLYNLARVDTKRGQYAAGIAKLKLALEKFKAKGTTTGVVVATCEFHLAKALVRTDRRVEADAVFKSALDHVGTNVPAWHPDKLRWMTEYADEWEKAGHPERAEEIRLLVEQVTNHAAVRIGN